MPIFLSPLGLCRIWRISELYDLKTTEKSRIIDHCQTYYAFVEGVVSRQYLESEKMQKELIDYQNSSKTAHRLCKQSLKGYW